jgi:REP element-mobilizing transposase RayT
MPIADAMGFNASMDRYFLTWTTYGTWLHGDARGWADRKDGYHRGKHAEDPLLTERRRRQLKHAPTVLTTDMRGAVDAAIRSVCDYRGWTLRELNVRTNHVHVVVLADKPIDHVLRDFKAYATRALRAERLIGPKTNVWTDGGDKVVIPQGQSLGPVCAYVRDQ